MKSIGFGIGGNVDLEELESERESVAEDQGFVWPDLAAVEKPALDLGQSSVRQRKEKKRAS